MRPLLLIAFMLFSGCAKPAPPQVTLDGVAYTPALMIEVASVEGKPLYMPSYLRVQDYEDIENSFRKDLAHIMWITDGDNYSKAINKTNPKGSV